MLIDITFSRGNTACVHGDIQFSSLFIELYNVIIMRKL